MGLILQEVVAHFEWSLESTGEGGGEENGKLGMVSREAGKERMELVLGVGRRGLRA